MLRRAAWPILTTLALPAAALVSSQLPGTEAAIVVARGNQTEPALSSPSGSFVAFTDAAKTPTEVWHCRLDGLACVDAARVPAARQPGVGDCPRARQSAPVISGDILVYVDEGCFGPGKGNVFRFSITAGQAGAPEPVSPHPAFQGHPAVSERLVAWEDGRDAQNGPDIWVQDNRPGRVVGSITGPGEQAMPRASGARVSYLDLDDPKGGVKVYDLDSGNTTTAFPASARAADIDGDFVVVQTSGGDLEVWSFDGTRQASLVLPGSQTNPHISGEWVAFEDFSPPTFTNRVIVWKWHPQPGDPPGPLLFAPSAGDSTQVLNDISWPRVVYADDRNQTPSRDNGLDIFLFDASATGIPGGKCDRDRDEDEDEDDDDDDEGEEGEHHGRRGDDDHGRRGDGDDDEGQHRGKRGKRGHRHRECDDPPGVRCDDPGALVLADLTVERERRGPESKNLEFQAEAEMPVRACLDADGVSSAWVLLNGRALARPDDFDPHVTHLERSRTVEAGTNRLSAIIAGKPGSRLRVRLLADGEDPPGGATAGGQGLEPPRAQGCSPGGSESSTALWLAVLLLYRRPRRE